MVSWRGRKMKARRSKLVRGDDIKRWLVVPILAALLQCGGGKDAVAAHSAPPASGLNIYLYTDVATDLAARQTFFAFVQSRNVRRVYLESAGLLGTSRSALADFVAEAKAHGLSVTLLFGHANWALTANHGTALQWATQSLAFLAELKAAGRPTPDAIQFDIEPYTLPEWTTDLQGTANQYLDLLVALRSQLNGQLAFTVATPFWLDGQPVTRAGQTRPMSEWILDAVDGIVMMDYRDRAQAILSEASSELSYASAHGKSVVIALNVQADSDPTITFWEEGQAFLYQEMATVDASARTHVAYQGLGVFNYDDWRLLRP
jgi:hypothetical protein